MKIENFKKAAPYKLYLPILLLISTIFIVYSFIDTSNHNFIWLIIGGLLAFLYIYLILKKPHYFEIETKQKNFIIRFFNPHPFMARPKAFDIPISNFQKYEIIKGFAGLSKNLVIYIKKGKATGSYPPVSISLLDKNQIEELKKELNYILKVKSLK